MIEQKVTYNKKFTCDRCGKEAYSNDAGVFDCNIADVVAYCPKTSSRNDLIYKSGSVCEDCKNEFVAFIENFFDEANKIGTEGDEE
jgi:hypothetical protein